MSIEPLYNKNQTVVTNSVIIKQKLDEIRITEEILLEAVMAGLLGRLNSTNFDTKNRPGYIQWNDTNSKLRFLTHNKGWDVYQEEGIEGIISYDKKIRIIPSSGNAATGNPNQPSSNKNPKGERGIKVMEPSSQGNLFTGYPEAEEEHIKTYVLLYYSNNDELRAELSEPNSINTNGKITSWKERLILQKQLLNNTEIEIEKTIDEEIDIPVIRKRIEG